MRLWNYIEQGGSIMYILLIMNIFGLSLLLWRVLVILKAKNNVEQYAGEIKESLSSLNENNHMLEMIRDEVSMRVHALEFGLNTIKVIASIAPLLGLLGTVVGIFTAFQVIAEKGLSDPGLFAGGISVALITTVGGLIVAIPHFIGQYYLIGLLDDFELRLEKASIVSIVGKKGNS